MGALAPIQRKRRSGMEFRRPGTLPETATNRPERSPAATPNSRPRHPGQSCITGTSASIFHAAPPHASLEIPSTPQAKSLDPTPRTSRALVRSRHGAPPGPDNRWTIKRATGMESITRLPGIRPLALPRLPADFFAPPPDPAAPAPLGLEWPRRGATFRLTGCPLCQAAFRAALAEYEAAEAAAALARCSGDLRGFFAATTETHRVLRRARGLRPARRRPGPAAGAGPPPRQGCRPPRARRPKPPEPLENPPTFMIRSGLRQGGRPCRTRPADPRDCRPDFPASRPTRGVCPKTAVAADPRCPEALRPLAGWPGGAAPLLPLSEPANADRRRAMPDFQNPVPRKPADRLRLPRIGPDRPQPALIAESAALHSRS